MVSGCKNAGEMEYELKSIKPYTSMDGSGGARKVVSRWRKRPAIGAVNNKSGVGWTEITTPKPRHVKKRNTTK